jgi:hypothetical protein
MIGPALPRRSPRRQPRLPGLIVPPGQPRCRHCENAAAMVGWRLCRACYDQVVLGSRQSRLERNARPSKRERA